MVRNMRLVYKKIAFVSLFNAKKIMLISFTDHEIYAFKVVKVTSKRTVFTICFILY